MAAVTKPGERASCDRIAAPIGVIGVCGVGVLCGDDGALAPIGRGTFGGKILRRGTTFLESRFRYYRVDYCITGSILVSQSRFRGALYNVRELYIMCGGFL